MLHLENFFEKSFALLLTTPNDTILKNESLTKEKASAILYDTKLKC